MKRLLGCAAVALLLLAGNAHGQQKMTPVPGRPAAVDFTLPDMKGKRHRLSDQRGKVVFVNFWATWCTPCRREMPSMQRLWDKVKGDGFVMYGVNLGEDEERISAFEFEVGVDLTFPLLLDRSSAVARQWRVPGLPSTYIVAPDGRIAYRAIGERDWDDPKLIDAIRALLRAPAGAQHVRN